MVVTVLISLVVLIGGAMAYFYLLAPRLNPLNRADRFLSQSMVNEAILEYKKILDDNPDDYVAHWRLATILFDRREIDEGVHHLEEILRVNSYNYEVEKAAVERKLAEAYLLRDDLQKAFQNYFDVLREYPGDEEALYQVAFILLGQEYFDLAQRYFERLLRVVDKNFEILFGAGIASYQNQKTNEPVEYFKDALAIEPRSDIGNLAMAFALQRKCDYKTALGHARVILDGSGDDNALFIARRLYGILCVQAKRPAEGVKALQPLLEQARSGDMNEELAVVLYDLGFAALSAEMAELAYDAWNELYQLNRNFRNVQFLVPQLRREIDTLNKPGAPEAEESVMNYTDDWLRDTFPAGFLWDICGLKAERTIDLSGILSSARADVSREDSSQKRTTGISGDADERVEALGRLDMENFRIIANRVVGKLGYRVDEILPTYREGDGVDFLAFNTATKEKVLVWVRRWSNIRISEIPLRNLAQAVNDIKAKQGVFITTSELTEAGMAAVQRLQKIRVVFPQELGGLLAGLI
ncbi:MAG: restriction endonuclease [Spirochaetes bacterium]|nr:restriction endonuclease [Spirochaetota bacterium]